MLGQEFLVQLEKERQKRILLGKNATATKVQKVEDKFDFYYEERGQKYNDPNNYLQLAFGDWKEKELERLHYQEEREKLYEEEMQALEDEIAHLAKRRAICRNIIYKADPDKPDEKERSVRAHFEIIKIDKRLDEIEDGTGLVTISMVDGPKFPRKVRKIRKAIRHTYSDIKSSIRETWWTIENKIYRMYRAVRKFCRKRYRRVRKFCKRNSELVFGIATAVVGFVLKKMFPIPILF